MVVKNYNLHVGARQKGKTFDANAVTAIGGKVKNISRGQCTGLYRGMKRTFK